MPEDRSSLEDEDDYYDLDDEFELSDSGATGIRTRLVLSLGVVVLGEVIRLAGGIAARLTEVWFYATAQVDKRGMWSDASGPSPKLQAAAGVLDMIGAVVIGAGLIATVVVAYRWARDADQGDSANPGSPGDPGDSGEDPNAPA